MRRVVTGHDGRGRSVIVSDGEPPRSHAYKGFPGFVFELAGATEPGEPVSGAGDDITTEVGSYVPEPGGGTRLLFVTIPPDAHMALPSFDGPLYAAEQLKHGPGLGELFEPDGMHTTPTVDYVILLEGELWLELDDGELTRLVAGDVVVQNATRHAWRNRSDQPARMAVVLIGAAPAQPAEDGGADS
ncbi:cupin domain-containing protein [Streptomyces griseorubiginosus]|nr:cupin domain-containing protein [Streptomyces griseorubiginosus]